MPDIKQDAPHTITPGLAEPAADSTNLPVPVAAAPAANAPVRPNHRWRTLLVVLLLLGAGGIGGFYWWQQRQTALPSSIAFGNGRIEADEIDIATKFPGRIATLLADEGDMVKQGQVLARMDVQDLQASLGKARAEIRAASQTIAAAEADLAQRASQLKLAAVELRRAQILYQQRDVGRQVLDQRQAQYDSAAAGVRAVQANIAQARHMLDAAQQDATLIAVNIADNSLTAPRPGRIQYRLANVGEVLPAGGKVFTMLDPADVYMNIYLPMAQAGKAAPGTDARIVLDAFPEYPIAAKVSFIASEAQFTPKLVETRSEREKLMFRIKLRVDPAILRAHAAEVRAGLPGVGYVRLDPQIGWPANLVAKGSAR